MNCYQVNEVLLFLSTIIECGKTAKDR